MAFGYFTWVCNTLGCFYLELKHPKLELVYNADVDRNIEVLILQKRLLLFKCVLFTLFMVF